MNSLNDILKKFTFLSRLGYGETLQPHRDWMALLSLALIALTASLAWNVWHFFGTVEREYVRDGAPAAEALDRNTLQEGRAVLENRAAEHERYVNEYSFIDPSK